MSYQDYIIRSLIRALAFRAVRMVPPWVALAALAGGFILAGYLGR
jgi:hypothetical protein